MHAFLDWFRLEELFQLILIGFMLASIGMQMTKPDSETYRRARRTSAAVFLLYAGMGIYAWAPDGATELLLITIRATLAACVAFGLALVTLAPAAFIVSYVKAAIPKARPTAVAKSTPIREAPAPIRDYAGDEQSEKDRVSKIGDARKMTEHFYAEHAGILAETLPQALFMTQMQTRFPDRIEPDEAWNAAQASIMEMMPLIKAAREKKRADDEDERKRADLAAQEQKPADNRSEVQKITEWYQKEKEMLLTLPDEPERENFLNQLEERCDRMIKDALAGAKP